MAWVLWVAYRVKQEIIIHQYMHHLGRLTNWV